MRIEANYSQRTLASKLKVPHSWVAKVESGERRIDILEFIWFSQACDRNLTDVFDEVVDIVAHRGKHHA